MFESYRFYCIFLKERIFSPYENEKGRRCFPVKSFIPLSRFPLAFTLLDVIINISLNFFALESVYTKLIALVSC